jgi:sugar lactone lactonase YvrE
VTGIAFGESPRWHDDRLWFADWGTHEIIAVDADGEIEVVVRLPFRSFQPICFDWLPDGNLIVVSSRDRRLLRRTPDGRLEDNADLGALSEYPWNEIVVDGRGNAYVNEAGFAFPGGEFAPGTIALVAPHCPPQRVADGVAFPNGMAVSTDNSTLICAESYASKLTAFGIAPDGTLSGGRVWAQLGDDNPDGICIDAEGAVWYGDVPHRRCVRVAEGGEVLDSIDLELGCFACMLGGADGTTLFMVVREWRGVESTADQKRTGKVLTAEAPAPGAGWP